MYDGVLDEFLSYDESLLVALRTVDPAVVLLAVEVLRDTDPDDAGLLDAVEPLPTAARVAAVLLVPNDVLEVVAVLRPTETPLPEGVLFTLAVVLPAMVF